MKPGRIRLTIAIDTGLQLPLVRALGGSAADVRRSALSSREPSGYAVLHGWFGHSSALDGHHDSCDLRGTGFIWTGLQRHLEGMEGGETGRVR
jgi:hypothetical protein